jgi:hypothetical protein
MYDSGHMLCMLWYPDIRFIRYNWDMDDMGILGMFSYAQFIVGLFIIMMITGR